MFCRKCGQEVKQGAKFCIKCGTPVAPQPQPQQPQQAQQPPQAQQPQAQQPQQAQAQQPQPQQPQPQAQPQRQQQARPQQQAQPQQPQAPQKAKKNTGLIIALICLIVILLIAVAALGGYFFYTNYVRNEVFVEERREDRVDEETDEEDERLAETEEVKDTEEALESTEAKGDVAERPLAEEAEKPHTYQIVVKDVTWTEAYREALKVPNGYLVNIDTQEEWDTILKQIQAEQKEDCIFWIGAVRRGESEDYHWVDSEGNSLGEPLNGNSNWLTGEPTFYDEENRMEERYVDMFFSKSENRWVWNDTPDDLVALLSYYSGKMAYIVEIEDE